MKIGLIKKPRLAPGLIFLFECCIDKNIPFDMLPSAAKLWILSKKKKKIELIFQSYFSRKFIDEIDGSRISQIRWIEPRLGHNRILLVPRFQRNKDLFKNKVRDESLSNLKGKKYSGLMTDYVMLGIKRSFEKMLVYSEPFMAYDFKTDKHRSATMIAWLLTIPWGYGPLKGKTFNQLVSDLIKRIGQKYPKFRMYLGKNEYTSNGMEHCHLDVNIFIDYYWLHKSWFTILKKQECFQLWLADHPTNDPDHPHFDKKSKDNLVGYRPLWTASRCISYLNNYLKKMTQNQTPIQGRVWFQSKYLANLDLPLIQFSYEQEQKLEEAKNKDYVKATNVNINSYKVDSDGVVSDKVHHSKTLCTIYKSVYKKKDTKSISDFLTPSNRNRLINYRIAAREGTQGPTPHSAAYAYRVVWSKKVNDKSIEGRPPGINSLPEVGCPDIFAAYALLDKSSSDQVFYSKVEFDKL